MDKDCLQIGVLVDIDDDDQMVGIELMVILVYGKNGQEILVWVVDKVVKVVKLMIGY